MDDNICVLNLRGWSHWWTYCTCLWWSKFVNVHVKSTKKCWDIFKLGVFLELLSEKCCNSKNKLLLNNKKKLRRNMKYCLKYFLDFYSIISSSFEFLVIFAHYLWRYHNVIGKYHFSYKSKCYWYFQHIAYHNILKLLWIFFWHWCCHCPLPIVMIFFFLHSLPKFQSPIKSKVKRLRSCCC